MDYISSTHVVQRKVMFSVMSVCLSVHTELSYGWALGHCPAERLPSSGVDPELLPGGGVNP